MPGREKASRYRQGGGEAMENIAEWAGVHTSHTFTALGHHYPLPSSLGGLTLALSTQNRHQKAHIKPEKEASSLAVSLEFSAFERQ